MSTSRLFAPASATRVASVACASFALVLASACGSTKSADSGLDGGAALPAEAGSSDAAIDGPSVAPATPDAAAADGAPPGECAGEATQTACVTCCSTKYQDGAGAYLVALIDCMCTADNCAKDCAASLCIPDAPKAADPACATCLDAKNSACAPTVTTACKADPNCVAFDACVGQSRCATK
jgi:hypothetical protein